MSAKTDRPTTTDQDNSSRSHALERVTVNLTPRSSDALRRTVEMTKDTKTDAINRALQIYAFLEEVWHDNGAVYVKQGPDGELQLLRAF